jgi:two-component system cell cycle response regulator DivK
MSKTILIVEDNELNMKLFQDLLEAHGYRTIPAATAARAFELINEAQA